MNDPTPSYCAPHARDGNSILQCPSRLFSQSAVSRVRAGPLGHALTPTGETGKTGGTSQITAE